MCLRFSCSSLCIERLKENSDKYSPNILLHFCSQLRTMMPLNINPQAAHEQSCMAAMTKLTNTKKTKQYNKPTVMFWINMSSQYSISG